MNPGVEKDIHTRNRDSIETVNEESMDWMECRRKACH